MAAHRFIAGGFCVWCLNAEQPARVTPELVADRRAPPFCVNSPDEMQEREFTQNGDSANDATGY